MTDNQEEKILNWLIESNLSSYYVSKKTGISAQSIINYRNRSTKPTPANVKLLEYFFNEETAKKNREITETSIAGSGNQMINSNGDISNSTFDNRQYYSDSPDVLRAQIEVLDERIKEKDAQIKEKDAQIKELLNIVSNLSKHD